MSVDTIYGQKVFTKTAGDESTPLSFFSFARYTNSSGKLCNNDVAYDGRWTQKTIKLQLWKMLLEGSTIPSLRNSGLSSHRNMRAVTAKFKSGVSESIRIDRVLLSEIGLAKQQHNTNSKESSDKLSMVNATDRIQRVSQSIHEDSETERSQEESKSPSLNQHLKKKYVKKVLKYLANDAKFAVKNLIINKVDAWDGVSDYYHCFQRRNLRSSEISSKAIFFGGEKCNVELASSTELAKATELLRDMVKALAELASDDSRQGAVVSPIDMVKKDSKEEKKLKELCDSLGNGLVEVPTHLPGVKGRVLKLFLQVNTGYEIADPMLVLMTAINWYFMFTGKKLLPACGPPMDPEKAEIEALNVELHEQLMEERYNEEIRPQSWEGLAKGLGQWVPNTPERGTSVPRVSLSPHQADMDVAK